MEIKDYFDFLVNEIHTTVVATVDEKGLPVTCAIDMMDFDENGIYFLSAKGKSLYDRLKSNKFIAFTGIKGNDTLSCVALSVRGKVREIGPDMLGILFDKNPYMNKIYPTEESRKALTVFYIYEGNGEWFDLSKLPIDRAVFTFGNAEAVKEGYLITDRCISCGKCLSVCPQGCIESTPVFSIRQEHCLHCGNCMNTCPVNAVEKIQ